jgi:HEAT repeat protein
VDKPELAAPDRDDLPIEPAQVEDMLRALSAALRSYRLYSGEGPMLERFVETARAKVLALWESVPLLRLEVDEQSIRWEGVRVYPAGDSGPELAFLFYKDGIREISLLPGFEDELSTFLRVLGSAPQVQAEEDDLITLLWQEDFSSFQYQYVEAGGESGGVDFSGETGTIQDAAPVDPESVRGAAADSSAGIKPEDFQETLYFLDEAELLSLANEVRREAGRDLWHGVLTALYDRMEDGPPERQDRILNILAEVLPSLLGTREFRRATGLLGELAELAARPGVLAPDSIRQVRELFAQLASPETIGQLVRMVEGDPEVLRDDALGALFNFFPPAALAPLARASSTITRPDVRRAFEAVVQRLANDNRDEVVRLVADGDPQIAAAAARWAGELGIGAATGAVTGLLKDNDPTVRLAAIETLVALRAGASGKTLEALLEDPEREVRIAAARGLAALEFAGARGVLEAALQSKRLRAADRSEKIAFFEAYGRLGGAEAVPLLDRTLNARSWLGRGESADIRACAALGLARVRHPSARVALAAAANDSDPVVKSAVARALRDEESS